LRFLVSKVIDIGVERAQNGAPCKKEDFMDQPEGTRASSQSLPPSTHHQLNMYALAAGTAGVAALALAPPAEAKVVYTPAKVPILISSGLYNLDLNNDGVTDFKITNTRNHNTDQSFFNLFAQGVNANGVAGTFVYGLAPGNAHVFSQGQQIGAGQVFFHGYNKMASFYIGGGGYSAHGNWVNVTNRYLGLRFEVGGQIHYGWARFNVQVLGHPVRIKALLTGYAYETDAGKAIAAGDTGDADAQVTPNDFNRPVEAPVMLGLLAMGTPGLTMWRREE